MNTKRGVPCKPQTLILAAAIGAALLASSSLQAQEKELDPGNAAYSGAPSGIDPDSTPNMMTSEGPAMTVEEFDHGKKIFFERCAGCHGVLRKGATGKVSAVTRICTPSSPTALQQACPTGEPLAI